MSDWDSSLKIFVNENAQEFVSWILKGAKVTRKLLTEFQVRTIRADGLFEVVLEEGGYTLHVGAFRDTIDEGPQHW